ncbi:MAG TPA: hypothetical protein VGE74_14160 [Gemmata sp.]
MAVLFAVWTGLAAFWTLAAVGRAVKRQPMLTEAAIAGVSVGFAAILATRVWS